MVAMGFATASFEDEKRFWVWPRPTDHSIGSGAAWLDEYTFGIRATKESFTHDILKQAFKRYQGLIATNKGVRSFSCSFRFCVFPFSTFSILTTVLGTYIYFSSIFGVS